MKLSEECVETALEMSQVLHKTQIFGPESTHNGSPTNRERTIEELNDLFAVAEMLEEIGFLPAGWLSDEKIAAKKEKVMKYMEISHDLGFTDLKKADEPSAGRISRPEFPKNHTITEGCLNRN